MGLEYARKGSSSLFLTNHLASRRDSIMYVNRVDKPLKNSESKPADRAVGNSQAQRENADQKCKCCGYPLFGLRSSQCPECGASNDTERLAVCSRDGMGGVWKVAVLLAISLIVPSYLTIASSPPSIISPASVLVAVPVVAMDFSATGTLVPTVLFVAWVWVFFRKRITAIWGMHVLASGALLTNLAWILIDLEFAARYYGWLHVLWVMCAVIILGGSSVLAGIRVARRQSIVGVLLNTYFVFMWLAWVGYPYLGELP